MKIVQKSFLKAFFLFLITTHAWLVGDNVVLSNEQKPNAFLQHEPLVVPVIMVKNEALVIEKTLQPYVDVGINHFFVFDTGSTDETIAVTHAFFKKNNITNGVIAQEPFVNFEVSRNRALDLAEQQFPAATFLIMPDAEWYLQNPQGLINFCVEHKYDTAPSYALRIVHKGKVDYFNLRMVRCKTNTRFVYPVHECICGDLRNALPKSVYFAWNDEDRGYQKSNERWYRDLAILQEEYRKNPRDTRTVFYLAQTYDCLNLSDEAYKYYKERAAMDKCEESFSAQYRAGIVCERMGDWNKALDEYLLAFAMDPSRIEPLMHIAQHYAKPDLAPVCKLFTQEACKKSYPHHAMLLVEKDAYEFRRYDLMAYGAWFTQDYYASLQALKAALLARPDAEHIQNNITLLEEMTKTHARKQEPTILHLHFKAAGPGGIETHMSQLFEQLTNNGIKNIALTSKDSHHVTDLINNQQPATRCLHYYHDDFYPREQDIEQQILDHNVGVVVCNSRGHLATCARLRKKYPIRIVYMHHFLFNFTDDNINYLGDFDAVVTADPTTAKHLQALRNKGVLKTPIIEHIPPYYNEINFLKKNTATTKSEFFASAFGITISNDTPVITMVANMYDAQYKNHPLLLKAAASLKAQGRRFALVLAGDGQIKNEFIRQSKELGIDQQTFFIGSTLRVPELLEHTDIHVLASTCEGFGLAHIEAAMKYKPFVAARATGIAPYIQDGVNGYLFENNNVDDLTAKLALLLDYPEQRIAMGNAAYALVREQFTTPILTQHWLSLLARVLHA